jgi:hypothetical protein
VAAKATGRATPAAVAEPKPTPISARNRQFESISLQRRVVRTRVPAVEVDCISTADRTPLDLDIAGDIAKACAVSKLVGTAS